MVLTCTSPSTETGTSGRTGCALLNHYSINGIITVGSITMISYDYGFGDASMEEVLYIGDTYSLHGGDINARCAGCYPPAITLPIKGNLTNTGTLNTTDAYIILQIVVGNYTAGHLPEFSWASSWADVLWVADFNGDGEVTSLDSLMVSQIVAGGTTCPIPSAAFTITSSL